MRYVRYVSVSHVTCVTGVIEADLTVPCGQGWQSQSLLRLQLEQATKRQALLQGSWRDAAPPPAPTPASAEMPHEASPDGRGGASRCMRSQLWWTPRLSLRLDMVHGARPQVLGLRVLCTGLVRFQPLGFTEYFAEKLNPAEFGAF